MNFRAPEDKRIYKIVITGGPCAGKTTALGRIRDDFTKKGYYVLTVPETATELISAGIAPWTQDTPDTFQKILMKRQLEKEKLFFEIADSLEAKVLVVLDRGVLDGKAYMSTDMAFDEELGKHGLDDNSAKARYDAVFHLVTAAIGAENHYTVGNNTARTESLEKSEELDRKVASVWDSHKNFYVIDNENGVSFEEKLNKLIYEISAFLGEAEPMEIERKFLIEYPDVEWLENLSDCRRLQIVQTYLVSDKVTDEIRVRATCENGCYTYTKTVKKKITAIKRVELENTISEEEYKKELENADRSKAEICKTRYCIMCDDKKYEIDLYPFWKDRAVMEIELCDENEEFNIPDGIKIIKEITGDENYKNSAIAKLMFENKE